MHAALTGGSRADGLARGRRDRRRPDPRDAAAGRQPEAARADRARGRHDRQADRPAEPPRADRRTSTRAFASGASPTRSPSSTSTASRSTTTPSATRRATRCCSASRPRSAATGSAATSSACCCAGALTEDAPEIARAVEALSEHGDGFTHHRVVRARRHPGRGRERRRRAQAGRRAHVRAQAPPPRRPGGQARDVLIQVLAERGSQDAAARGRVAAAASPARRSTCSCARPSCATSA